MGKDFITSVSKKNHYWDFTSQFFLLPFQLQQIQLTPWGRFLHQKKRKVKTIEAGVTAPDFFQNTKSHKREHNILRTHPKKAPRSPPTPGQCPPCATAGRCCSSAGLGDSWAVGGVAQCGEPHHGHKLGSPKREWET